MAASPSLGDGPCVSCRKAVRSRGEEGGDPTGAAQVATAKSLLTAHYYSAAVLELADS